MAHSPQFFLMIFFQKAYGAGIGAALFARALAVPRPRPLDLRQRLAMLKLDAAPLEHPVAIRWDSHQIPFIEAQSDTDLAAALGVVHAHLRLGQIDLMRRLALGRLAAVAGPLALEVDRTIHLIGLDRAVPGIIAGLPAVTRDWAQAFVNGVNHSVASSQRPYEHRLLGIRPEPWSLTDFFTVARLVSADLTWLVAARLLRAQRKAGAAWPSIWPKLLAGGAPPLFDVAGDAGGDLLARHMRAGSNSAAVAGWRSASGGALIASDPHLGLGLPNNWLIAGLRSPSISAVGLMLPGMPFVALGRNDHVAWGGTSLHAASSELIDVSGLNASDFTEHVVQVAVRGAGTQTMRLRESPFGPVVSDGLLLKDSRPLALRWVGHAPSDELTAMLGVMRATSVEAFNAALDGFAVPGQMMVVAAADGRVGKRAAVHMPRRADAPGDIVTTVDDAWGFADVCGGDAMPRWVDPPDGAVVSANEKPDRGDIPLGFFFSPGDRARRLRALLGGGETIDEAAMHAAQRDTLHPGALAVRDGLLTEMAGAPADFVAALRGWDGTYDASSTGALAHELLVGHLLTDLFPPESAAGFGAVWGTRLLLLAEMRALPLDLSAKAVRNAVAKAVPDWRKWRVWGAVHRYRPSHHFAALPLLGRRFRSAPFPAPGGDDTLHKTGHGLVRKPHVVGFGACARHVSDMADPDANRFVLLGGQDGWLGSSTFVDQVPLWQRGETITVPMRPDAVAAAFPHITTLRPG
jgi:penicillin amidase